MITKSIRNVVVLAVVLSFPCAASAWDSYRDTKDYHTRYTKYKYPDCEHYKTHSVPDGGTTLLLLGTALTGIGAARRFMEI